MGERFEAVVAQARKLVRPTLIAVLVTAALSLVAAQILRSAADRNVDTWLRAARHQAPPDSLALVATLSPPQSLTERLTQQTTEIRREAYYHLAVAKGFARYHFSSVTIAAFAAVLAGILLVPISWKGWQQADPWFVAFFLALAATASVFSASNRLYGQADAVSQHSVLYSSYLSLEDQLQTFRAASHPPEDSIRFVEYVDSMVASLRTLGVNFDPDAAPTIESVIESIPGAGPPAGP